ncbi:BBE domain-containing protein [Streptomyces sp. SBT349]|uniref:BBE domain-containing protein n=1 Tax=Streptomyces sp. SBT349 TaxID=1580539 RepID=UPI00066CE901|nr:BBE domain-containing protein [Streptomyces sp. SBT349]
MIYALTLVGPGEADERRECGTELMGAVRPWAHGRKFPNILSMADATPERIRAAYEGPVYERLRSLKATHDPDNLFRLNHNIPPGTLPALRSP